jgi:hypothetical protein
MSRNAKVKTNGAKGKTGGKRIATIYSCTFKVCSVKLGVRDCTVETINAMQVI